MPIAAGRGLGSSLSRPGQVCTLRVGWEPSGSPCVKQQESWYSQVLLRLLSAELCDTLLKEWSGVGTGRPGR